MAILIVLIGTGAAVGSQSSAAPGRQAALPVLSISDAATLQFQTGNSTLSFKVALSAPSTLPVTVDYATREGDTHTLGAQAAGVPEDFLAAAGTLTFAPGEVTKTIDVTVVPEPGVLNEADEYMGVDMAHATNALLDRFQAVGTIHYTRNPRPGDVNIQTGGKQGQCVKTTTSSTCEPVSGLHQLKISDVQYVNPGTGAVLIQSVAGKGSFSGTPFKLHEAKLGKTKRPLLVLTLIGGKFGICVSKATVADSRSPAAFDKKKKPVRRLWGHGRGRFQTRGRYSAGTVRGTTWETLDRCDGTVTVVRTGVVDVYDFVLKKHVRVPAGSSYLASPSQKP